jgi:hypothetical protein
MCSVLIVLFSLTATPTAQTIRTASIAGTIVDESNAVLPGVTVTLTSPALLVPQLVAVSDIRGEYRVVDLPPGTFKLSYELPGFGTLVRESVVVTAGFNARLDISMTVATQNETITVIGQGPIVDVTSTRGGATVGSELLELLPSAHNYQDTLLLVPGAAFNGPPMNGETGFRGHIGSFKSYGLQGQDSLSIEGIETIHNDTPDFLTADEVDAKTYGNTAEVSFPGPAVQFIVKSGGNSFNGRLMANGVTEWMQSSNIDDELRAQGVTKGDAPVYYWKASGDLGGRIIRDRLWFYTAANELHNLRTAPGYVKVPGADGIYHTADDPVGEIPGRGWNRTAKFSFQATHKHRVIAFFARDLVSEPELYADRLTPFENTAIFLENCNQQKGEWQGTFSDRLIANLMFGRGYYVVTYDIQNVAKHSPARLDRETGYWTGSNWRGSETLERIPNRTQFNGSLSYFPRRSFLGQHQLRAGFNMWWGSNRAIRDNNEPGNYAMVFDRVSGVSYTPVELQTRNYPNDGLAKFNTFGAYVSDSWSPASRVTLNLGLRTEAQSAWLPPQEKVQGDFGGSGSYPRLDVGSWFWLAPRVGVAFDLTGDGRTVAKATYGTYYFNLGGTSDFAHQYNPNATVLYTYRWHDLNGDKAYQAGEVDLSTTGPDFLTVSGSSNNIINPDLDHPVQHEVTASIERDLGAGMSIRGLYVYKGAYGQTGNTNVLRPYEVWNREFTRRDPGPDGVLNNADDGGMVTIYDFDPAYAGSNYVGNMLINSDRTDRFNNYEISLNRRKSGRWFALTSVVFTKNHRWLTLVSQSPNDDVNNLDETWDYSYRLASGYDLAYGLTVSGVYQLYNGFALQRTNLFRAVDPDGGPRFPSSGSINMRVEPFGAQRAPIRQVANVRLSKDVDLGASRHLVFDLDVTNVFNTNVPWGSPTSGDGNGLITASGPTYGYVTRITQPRAFRLGASFTF